MTTPRRIVIDCDPGIDDAVAILLAIADATVEIAAVTAVHGNKVIEATTANAIRVLDLGRRADIPVWRGADRPLVIPEPERGDYYGRDGLGDVGLPPPSRDAGPGHAADALVETVMSAPAGTVSLVAIGPLTNVALAMRLDGRFAGRLGGLIVMGGDVAPGAPTEFNVGTDPAAAAIVLSGDAPLTLVPYNVTRAVHAASGTLRSLAASPSGAARAVAAMQRTREPAGSALHDACALATLLAPDLFTFATGTASVTWRDADRQGETVFAPSSSGSHRVVTGLDSAGFDSLLVSAFTALA